MNPLNGDFLINNGNKDFILYHGKNIMLNNQFIRRVDADWYSKCNRYGWIDPFDNDRVTKEFLFFTKPDLNIIKGADNDEYSPLNENDLQSISPTIYEIYKRQPEVITQLQHNIKNPDGTYGNFMYLLSNSISSKLELPSISADSHESPSTLMGTNIQYRGHSYKSDNGYDFTLGFKDTAYLEVYALAKVYDEHIRLCKKGIMRPKKKYVENHIDPTQFSIYKFLIGSDGETILFYAKLTGCYITDVPRSDLSDPGDEGIKFSLSFHANYVEELNPLILAEFNIVSKPFSDFELKSSQLLPVFDPNTIVNNEWGRYPHIQKIVCPRSNRRNVAYDYHLKWYNN